MSPWCVVRLPCVIDIRPPAARLARIVAALDDDDLGRPTPCAAMSVGDLVDHVAVFAERFVGSGRKLPMPDAPAPPPDAANLEDGWRERVAGALLDLAEAWSSSAAWEGTSYAGTIEMPAAMAGRVALDELVVHGWDLAVATGQRYEASDAEVEGALEFVATFDIPADRGIFAAPIVVPDDARPLDRLLGLTGRDPSWRPS